MGPKENDQKAMETTSSGFFSRAERNCQSGCRMRLSAAGVFASPCIASAMVHPRALGQLCAWAPAEPTDDAFVMPSTATQCCSDPDCSEFSSAVRGRLHLAIGPGSSRNPEHLHAERLQLTVYSTQGYLDRACKRNASRQIKE